MAERDLMRIPRFEIDSGVRITVLDGSTQIAIVYRPPAENPPAGFDSAKVYYYVTAEIPSSTSTLTLSVALNNDSPGFSAGSALSATSAALQEQGSAPSSSSTLWVDKTNQSWALDWQLSGTGTEARGTVTWWRAASTLFTASSGSHDAANSTTVPSNVVWKGADSPA